MQGLTPSEKKGVIVIIVVIALASIIRLLKPFEIDPRSYDYSTSDSVFTRISRTKYTEVKSATEQKTKMKTDEKAKLRPRSIDLNLASKSDLVKLPRIGPAIAQRIIDYREAHGKFSSLNELKNVKGIGTKTLDNIRPYLKDIGK
jgi:comEA protein